MYLIHSNVIFNTSYSIIMLCNVCYIIYLYIFFVNIILPKSIIPRNTIAFGILIKIPELLLPQDSITIRAHPRVAFFCFIRRTFLLRLGCQKLVFFLAKKEVAKTTSIFFTSIRKFSYLVLLLHPNLVWVFLTLYL